MRPNFRSRIQQLEKRNFRLEQQLVRLEERISHLEKENFNLFQIFYSSLERIKRFSHKRFIKIYKN